MTQESKVINEQNEEKTIERVTVVVMPRDRFSTTEKCIECIFQNTSEPFDLMVLLGGAPDKLKERLEFKYSSRARLIFKPGYLNGSELRNEALKLIQTRLAVFIDSEVFVRPNWFAPLIQCQVETGAKLVVPIILDRNNLIHTAGNDFFITHEKGKTIGGMELRYANHYVGESTNIPRREIDFGEMHCQLVDVKKALDLGVYDERLREHQEMDAGLVWKKAGCKMMCEPKSMVYLYLPKLINDVDDVRLFIWKWDIDTMKESANYFYEKWNIDVNHKNHFLNYFVRLNRKVGFFSRLFPSQLSISMDQKLLRIREFLWIVVGKMVALIALQRKY